MMSTLNLSGARYRRTSTSTTHSMEDSDAQHDDESEPSLNLILTSISLVSGTAVGAGILAIASVSLKPGFIPSSITLVIAWGLMTTTGFLIAEITCNIARMDENAKNFGIIAITDRILGKYGSQSIGFLYVCFHYTLLIAYIAEAGGILSRVTHIPTVLGPIIFTTIMGSIIAFGSNRAVDLLNSAFFFIVVVTFLGLVCLGIGSVRIGNLGYQDYSQVGPTIPILLVALVFHNIIPTVCSNLLYQRRSIYIALVVGSSIPLAMFILWNAVILGMVNDYASAAHSDSLIDPVGVLLDDNPSGSKVFGKILITIFSESAIITSFIGFVIGLMEFYGDIFPRKSKKDCCLYALVLTPPTLVALGNPDIFLQALDAAGAYGISVLFGLLPAVLALRLRADAAKEVSSIFVSSADTAVHSALSTDSCHHSYDPTELTDTTSIDTTTCASDMSVASARDESGKSRNAGGTTGPESDKSGLQQLSVSEAEEGGSSHSDGIELPVLEARSLIRNHHSPSRRIKEVPNTDTRGVDGILSPIHTASADDGSGNVENASHSPYSHTVDGSAAYVNFVPGGDITIYFMMTLFVAIIIDKLVTG